VIVTVNKLINKSVNAIAILTQRLLLFDAMSPRFQIVKLRPRNPKCEACGDEPTIKELIDYVLFCSSGPHDKTPNKNILVQEEHIHPIKFHEIRTRGTAHLLVDVRDALQFEICSLPNSLRKEF
jgi:adenylyltransferase/sulfurtransferase